MSSFSQNSAYFFSFFIIYRSTMLEKAVTLQRNQPERKLSVNKGINFLISAKLISLDGRVEIKAPNCTFRQIFSLKFKLGKI